VIDDRRYYLFNTVARRPYDYQDIRNFWRFGVLEGHTCRSRSFASSSYVYKRPFFPTLYFYALPLSALERENVAVQCAMCFGGFETSYADGYMEFSASISKTTTSADYVSSGNLALIQKRILLPSWGL
jgi:hypothetical protein